MLNEYNFDKKTYAPLIRFENRTYYMHDVSAEASLQLYETKKCCIVATQTKRLGVDSHDFGKVNDRQIANMLIDNMMLRLFIDMNTSLLQIGE
jgi:Tfp pilus assembly ATPase PilU